MIKVKNLTRPTRECRVTLFQEEGEGAPFTEVDAIVIHYSPSLKWYEENKVADDADHLTLADSMTRMVFGILAADDRTPLQDDDGQPVKLDREFFAALHTDNLHAINRAIAESIDPKKSLSSSSPAPLPPKESKAAA